jgi:pilus assembly protein Flp/PilA
VVETYTAIQTYWSCRRAEIEERGATAVEYSLMVGLIALAIIGSVSLFGNRVKSSFNTISNTIPG